MTMARRDSRTLILDFLADGDWHTATDIQDAVGLAQSTVSSQLRVLTSRPWGAPLVEMESLPNPRWEDGRHGVPFRVTHYRLRSQAGTAR